MEIKGTELLVKALKAEGVELVFGYPGSTVMEIFDILWKDSAIEVFLPRHEQALGHEADGYARASGKPGVCVVTSGPGATNLVTAIANAFYDGVPLVCFTGQVQSDLIGSGAFQEVNIVDITHSLVKFGAVAQSREELGGLIQKAFAIATSGRPGPVVIDLPKDIMSAFGTDEYTSERAQNFSSSKIRPKKALIKAAQDILKTAQRPLILAGNGGKSSRCSELLLEIIEKKRIPVVTTLLGKGVLSTTHPFHIGHVGMHGHYEANLAISNCDVLLVLGARLNDRVTGNKRLFASQAQIIQVDIEAIAMEKGINPVVSLLGDSADVLADLFDYEPENKTDLWLAEIAAWRRAQRGTANNSFSPKGIFSELNQHWPKAIWVTDVGQHQMWAAQYLKLDPNRSLITSGGLGTMGFALPAAVGAALACKDVPVICLTGDGGFQMNQQELAAISAAGVNLKILIFNNRSLGMVRQWQKLFYDKSYVMTCLGRRRSCPKYCSGSSEACPEYLPDFSILAQAYNLPAYRVGTIEALKQAITTSNMASSTSIIECLVDEEELVFPMVKGGRALSSMILQGER